MHVTLLNWLLMRPNLLSLHFADWILRFLLWWAPGPRALGQPSAVQVQLEPRGRPDEHNAARHLPAQRKGEGCSWLEPCSQIQTCSNCLTESRLFLPDTEALSCWLSCLCPSPPPLTFPGVYFLFPVLSSLVPAWFTLILSSSRKLFLHLENSLLSFSASANAGHLVIYFSMAND